MKKAGNELRKKNMRERNLEEATSLYHFYHQQSLHFNCHGTRLELEFQIKTSGGVANHLHAPASSPDDPVLAVEAVAEAFHTSYCVLEKGFIFAFTYIQLSVKAYSSRGKVCPVPQNCQVAINPICATFAF